MTTTLVDLARVMGLDECADAIAEFTGLPAAAAPDPALAQEPATDAKTALANMVRRGLDPSLVGLLRAATAAMPVERGLLAWDVLNGSFVERGSFRDELRRDAALVAGVVAQPGCACVKPAPDATKLAGAPAGPRASGLMRALGAPVDANDASPAALERAREFSRALHRSHLPTMASFCLADLVYRQNHHRAIPDLVEVLLDAGVGGVDAMLEALGDPDPTGEPSMIELCSYARARTSINAGKPSECIDFAEKNRLTFEMARRSPGEAAAVNALPTLAYADAALRKRARTIPIEHVEAIARIQSAWRYALRVLTTYAALTTKSRDLLSTFGGYLQSFGNDYDAWLQVARAMPVDAQWASGLLALLVREAFALPHEPSVWKAAGVILGGDLAKAAGQECHERLREQATLA